MYGTDVRMLLGPEPAILGETVTARLRSRNRQAEQCRNAAVRRGTSGEQTRVVVPFDGFGTWNTAHPKQGRHDVGRVYEGANAPPFGA